VLGWCVRDVLLPALLRYLSLRSLRCSLRTGTPRYRTVENSHNGPIEEDAADLLLSADEISEAAPGEWQTENLGVVEGIEATGISGVDSANGVELAGEENNEIVFVVHVSETIEDVKEFFTDRDDEAEDDNQVEQDVGEEAFALFLSDEVRSLTTRERNILGRVH